MTNFHTLQLDGLQPSLLVNRIKIPVKNLDLLMRKIQVLPSGCWQWTGATSGTYGVVKIRAIRSSFLPAHRLCYELVNGPVPANLHVHHRVEAPIGCMGKLCVNPAHLQAVTPREHIVELTPGSAAYIAKHRNACKNGHKYTIETMRLTASGRRRCLVCERNNAQKARDRALIAEDRKKGKWREEFVKTHCKRGHEFTPENTYYQNGWRSCITCRRENNKKHSTRNEQEHSAS